ncbi:hypothetical protein U1Q18_035133 [Sarracenia purpurea var. burkii]
MVPPTTSLFSTTGFFFAGHRNPLHLLHQLTQLHRIDTRFLLFYWFALTVIGILLLIRATVRRCSLSSETLSPVYIEILLSVIPLQFHTNLVGCLGFFRTTSTFNF